MTRLLLAGGRFHLRGLTHDHGRLLVLALVVLVMVLAVVAVTIAVRRARRRARLRRAAEPDDAASVLPVAIHVDHLSKAYRLGRIQVRALDDISLDVREGEMVCIMGKSGSGKSTLLHQLSLIDRPTSGTVRVHGREVTRLHEADRATLRLGSLGYVFQEYALLPELTALENVRLPALMLGRSGEDHRERAAELLALVGLGARAGHRPRELSGGEQQRVAIARAIVNHPQIVYADELTANLDTQSARSVMETLRDLNRRLGVTILFVSHDPDDARYATRMIHLADGESGGSAGMRSLRVGMFLGVRAVLRGNRGIAVLTTLMMLLIYVSLLFLPSLIQGAVNRVNDQLVNTLTSDLAITPSGQGTTIQDVDAYLAQIRKTAGVEQATSVFRVGSQISYGSNSGSWAVLAVDPTSYAQVFTTPSSLFAGHYLSQQAPDQVFMGIGVAGAGQTQVRGYRSSLKSVQVGDQVSITLTNGRPYAFGVLGIYDDQFPLSDGNAFISMTQAQQLLPGIADQWTAVYVKTRSGADVNQVMSRLSKLRSGMKFETSADLGSVVQDQVATFTLISDILKAVSLLMAAVTIFMVTYVDLVSRRRQIGIQRAIGITSTAVVTSYLLKALAYAIAGVVCGYAAFVYVVTPIVQRHPFQFPNGPVVLVATWEEMVRDLVTLAAVSAAAALIPAIRSTHLRLLDAIWAS